MYHLDAFYCWFERGSRIVLMYSINGIPFTFDELVDSCYDIMVADEANQVPSIEPEDLYESYYYLIAEQCHPLLFDVEVENPELLPID